MTTSSISTGATSTGLQASAGLIWQVLGGGSAVGTLVSAGGSLEVSAGGVATATSVFSGGGDYVLAGGVASLTTVDSGGAEYLSGGSAFGATLASGGSQYVLSGGVAAVTVVGSGATQYVSGGSAFGTVLGSGGFQRVAAGGLASGTVASADNYIFVSSGGVASAATADSGGIAYVTGGSAVSITLASSGFAYVVFGGRTAGTVVGPLATAFVSSAGIDSGATIEAGGAEYVAVGGSAIATTIDGSGYLEVDAGGTATDASVLASGFAVVASGGVASGTTISAGGAALVVSGGSAAGATVASGGQLVVLSGGSATGTTLDAGGVVSSAAIVLQTPHGASAFASTAGPATVASGDTLYVVAGGVASGIALAGGEIVQGGTATATAVMGGVESVGVGGVVSRSTVGAAGVERVSSGGVAIATTVMSGGNVLVSQGGIASSVTVGAGGSAAVLPGGSAVAATIDTSGVLMLSSGGGAYGDIVLASAGATLEVAGTILPGVTISGFAAGDTIDLTDVAGASATLNPATDVLTVGFGGATYSAQLAGTYTGLSATAVTDGGTGTDISLACFAAGTLIDAPEGAVPVESLTPGQLVLTQAGRPAPVRWVGRRHVDCRRHPRPDRVRPVRIQADAFAPGQPRRDLLLSPDHAVFAAGVLIPVRYLVNGTTVAPLAVDSIAYLHVELDRHDVILAEGLPAESFLDTGNRAAFANGGGATDLHPDFARRVWHSDACADLVIAGAQLADVRRRLLARAASLGHRTTRDPALVLRANGRRLAAEVEGAHWRVRLGTAAELTLQSRTWVPGWIEAESGDMRTLGVAVCRLALDGRALPLASPRLGAGWHERETHWRWTDGAGVLDVAGAGELSFAIAMRGRYWWPASGSRTGAAKSA